MTEIVIAYGVGAEMKRETIRCAHIHIPFDRPNVMYCRMPSGFIKVVDKREIISMREIGGGGNGKH